MSTIAVIALVLTALWLALLTLVVVVLVRQTAILGVHLQRAASQLPAGSEGLDVGRAIPQAVLDTIPEARTGPAYVLVTSATCSPCRELVPALTKLRLDERVVALVPGRPELADSLVEMFPHWVRVIRDPEAVALAKALQVQATPFALEIEAGHVTGKSYLHSANDLQVLVRVRRSGERRLPATLTEVIKRAAAAS